MIDMYEELIGVLSPGVDQAPPGYGNANQPALDSYQAGSVGGGDFRGASLTHMPPQAAYSGLPPAPGQPQPPNIPGPGRQEQLNEMPGAYTQNRMAEMGMPKIAQWGEQKVDDWRKNRWMDKNQPDQKDSPVKPPPVEVDETQLLNAGGDAQTAFNNAQGGSQASRMGYASGQGLGMLTKALTARYG
jgi:hypothetical protein